jgi:hypothetical protein
VKTTVEFALLDSSTLYPTHTPRDPAMSATVNAQSARELLITVSMDAAL